MGLRYNVEDNVHVQYCTSSKGPTNIQKMYEKYISVFLFICCKHFWKSTVNM
jgi:hypothetical protein